MKKKLAVLLVICSMISIISSSVINNFVNDNNIGLINILRHGEGTET